jgi:hypothetical protein
MANRSPAVVAQEVGDQSKVASEPTPVPGSASAVEVEPTLRSIPDVNTDAVKSATVPVVIVSLVISSTFPVVVSIPAILA